MDFDNYSQTGRPLCRDTADRLIADDSVDFIYRGHVLDDEQPIIARG